MMFNFHLGLVLLEMLLLTGEGEVKKHNKISGWGSVVCLIGSDIKISAAVGSCMICQIGEGSPMKWNSVGIASSRLRTLTRRLVDKTTSPRITMFLGCRVGPIKRMGSGSRGTSLLFLYHSSQLMNQFVIMLKQHLYSSCCSSPLDTSIRRIINNLIVWPLPHSYPGRNRLPASNNLLPIAPCLTQLF